MIDHKISTDPGPTGPGFYILWEMLATWRKYQNITGMCLH